MCIIYVYYGLCTVLSIVYTIAVSFSLDSAGPSLLVQQ